MLKLILHNLYAWCRNRNNLWLMLELVLVTVVSWVVFDPLVVSLYDKTRPLGYDSERMCLVTAAFIAKSSSPFNFYSMEECCEAAANMKAVILNKRDDVESMSMSTTYCPDGQGFALTSQWGDSDEGIPDLNVFVRYKGEPTMATYGVKIVDGNATDLDSLLDSDRRGVAISRSVAMKFFGTEKAAGKYLWNSPDPENRDSTLVLAVIDDVRMRSYVRKAYTIVRTEGERNDSEVRLVVRLKEGADPERFKREMTEWIAEGVETGGVRLKEVSLYPEINERVQMERGFTNSVRMNVIFAVLFLFNLCLGVIGTFWLNVDKRREEIGVMRSFGATARNIGVMIFGEGFIITTVTVVLGCLIYLQYAVKSSLSVGFDFKDFRVGNGTDSVDSVAAFEALGTGWVYDFSTHFLIISTVVYVVMLVIVGVGMYIPVRKACRLSVTDALRE